MNLYFVKTKDMRGYMEPITDDGRGPTFEWWPMGFFTANTYGQAKMVALSKWDRPYNEVYSDDFVNLRAQLVKTDTDYPPWAEVDDDRLWGLIENGDVVGDRWFWPAEQCCRCHKFVGKDGAFHVEHFEMSSEIASMDATCARCLRRERAHG